MKKPQQRKNTQHASGRRRLRLWWLCHRPGRTPSCTKRGMPAPAGGASGRAFALARGALARLAGVLARLALGIAFLADRKSTRLNSSHLVISYAVFCLKKKKKNLSNSRSYHVLRACL